MANWGLINSLWTIRDLFAILVVLVLAFIGREFQLRVMTKVKSRHKWAEQFGEPILTTDEAKARFSITLALLIGAGLAAFLFQAACPFKME